MTWAKEMQIHATSAFEQAVNFLTVDREVERAKFRAGHELGQKNRATVPVSILALAVRRDSPRSHHAAKSIWRTESHSQAARRQIEMAP
jgi:hypothetical protein